MFNYPNNLVLKFFTKLAPEISKTTLVYAPAVKRLSNNICNVLCVLYRSLMRNPMVSIPEEP